MLKLQVIGNLGADARLVNSNGNEFVSMRVAHSENYTVNGQQATRTIWVDCTLNGNGGNLLQYLKKGAKVFVEGYPSFRVYDSAQNHCKMVGVQISVRSIELCGGSTDKVPSELTTTDGEIVSVMKCFYTSETKVHGGTLIDKELKSYDVDANGFISPHHD